MRRQLFRSPLGLLVLLHPLFVSCGSKSDSKAAPAVVVYGKIAVTTVKGDDTGTFELTSLTQCKRNADTGRVDIAISQGVGKPGMTLAIKDYSSSAKTYNCVQSTDNQTSTTDIGGKFESCMVAVTVLSTPTATTLNAYSMHRDAVTVKPFAYAGTCSIQVTEGSPAIKATIACTKMIQTQLEGAPRNPIDATATADVTANVNCTFQ